MMVLGRYLRSGYLDPYGPYGALYGGCEPLFYVLLGSRFSG